MRQAFMGMPKDLEEAARLEGCNIGQTFLFAMPLASALAKLQGQFSSNYPELMAASVIACIPMIMIYLLFQRQFIEEIATSGGKL